MCVTGGIAAYKAVEVARELVRRGGDVHVVMTPAARRFVGPLSFAGVTGNEVLTDLFGDPAGAHVELARGAALAVVAPATANSVAKMALGVADDLFSATLLMARCPIVIAPAMHTEMWEHPATVGHMRVLEARGAHVVGPDFGALMSGEEGPGRMAEPDAIVSGAVELLRAAHDLAGRRVLVTAGGTREPIDAVRFIGNRSSARMGFELAKAAARRGAKVTLVSGPTALEPPARVDFVAVTTADEMRDEVMNVAGDADAIVMAAAVADFRPARAATGKIKKAAGPPQLTLVPTPDILAELGSSRHLRKPGSVLVGFAAEDSSDAERLAELALQKRAAKQADVLVANDVASADSGFDVSTNRAVVAAPDGVRETGLVTKVELAETVMEIVARLLDQDRPASGGGGLV